MYDLTSVLEFDALSSVSPGTSMLVSGPAMTGKERMVMSLLTEGARAGEGAVVVSTNEKASDILADFEAEVPGSGQPQFGIVDCRGEGDGDSLQGAYVHHVSSPGDLTGIGIGITKALEGLHNSGFEQGRLALSSLSTMLTYTDKKTVFKFCHVLSSRLDAADYVGVFTIDSGAHDEQTIQVIKQAFDGLIEFREGQTGREVRVLGLAEEPTDWHAL